MVIDMDAPNRRGDCLPPRYAMTASSLDLPTSRAMLALSVGRTRRGAEPMREIDAWLDEQLTTPQGQLLWLLLALLIRLAFSYLKRRQEDRRASQRRKSQSA